ncbi:hypothetical protein [Lelliottia amnigena]
MIVEQEDGKTLTLSFYRTDRNSLERESHSVWEITNIFEMEGSQFELFTIPDSKAFKVGMLIRNTDEICMKFAVSADGWVFPVGKNNRVYQAVGHTCLLDNQTYDVYRDKQPLKS